MAIKFLDSIDLTKLELQNAVVQNLGTAPSSPVEGQIYYDTGDDSLKYYGGSPLGWITLDGQGGVTDIQAGTGISVSSTTGSVTVTALNNGTVTSVSTSNGTFINFTGGGNTSPTISGDLSATGNPSASTYLRGDNTWASIPGGYSSWELAADSGTAQDIGDRETVDIAGGTAISSVVSSPSGRNTVTLNHNAFGTAGTYAYPASVTTNATGHITSITAGSAPGTMDDFTVDGDTGSVTISDGNTLSILGSRGIDTVASATDRLTISLDLCELDTPDRFTSEDTLAGCIGGGNGQVPARTIPISLFGQPTSDFDMGGTHTWTNLPSPTVASEAATKGYVDNLVTGQLIYAGGYDARVAPPTGAAVLQGYTYAVTNAGDGNGFFTVELEPGDLIIANQNNPTTEAHWTEVNKNVDVATTTTVGVVKVPTSGGLSINSAGSITLPATGPGTSTKGSASKTITASIDTKGRITAFTDQNISITSSQVSNFNTSVDGRVDARTVSGSIATNTNTVRITHNFNTRDVSVTVFENGGSYQDVQALVERSSVNTVDVSVARNPSTALRVLVTKL